MRIGVCAKDYKDWEAVAASGFDYIEAHFTRIATADEETYKEMLSVANLVAEKYGVYVETTNCLFPPTVNLYAYDPETGEETDDFENVLKDIETYLENGFKRIVPMGLKVSVIGSAANRKLCEGMKPEVIERQFTEILKLCGRVAEKYGVKLVIEPLHDCNLVVTLDDAVRFAKAANTPSIGVLNDFYHSALNDEDITVTLDRARDLLYHMHIAVPEGRRMPTIDDKEIILGFCDEAKRAGYNGRISLEGRTQIPLSEMVKLSYEVMKLVR